MTTRRRRVTRNPIRRVFFTGAGTGTTPGATIVDLTPVPELDSAADTQVGELLVTGLSLIDAADEATISQCLVWVGRTSTAPNEKDTGVRTRQFPGNQQGLPFVLRFRGLRVNPGQILKLITLVKVETLATITYQHIVHVKWAFRELRQG